MRSDFAVFILSHGRPDRLYTLHMLEKGGYTGKTYIIIDDEDDTADEYHKRYGDKVIVFSKTAMEGTFDIGDNFTDKRVIVFARNACFDIAKKLGVKYFLELDDDYSYIGLRYPKNGRLGEKPIYQLDRLFNDALNFLEASNALTVTFGQGGDFMGGLDGGVYKKGLKRKAMNTFFCRTDRPVHFVGRINEDVCTYTTLGMRGEVLFTITNICLHQKMSQTNAGGMTDIYCDTGTYYKSFTSVMYAPSCVKVTIMGALYKRIHHRVKWNNCTPMIISEKWRK